MNTNHVGSIQPLSSTMGKTTSLDDVSHKLAKRIYLFLTTEDKEILRTSLVITDTIAKIVKTYSNKADKNCTRIILSEGFGVTVTTDRNDIFVEYEQPLNNRSSYNIEIAKDYITKNNSLQKAKKDIINPKRIEFLQKYLTDCSSKIAEFNGIKKSRVN